MQIKQINNPTFTPQKAPAKIHKGDMGIPKVGVNSNAIITPIR